MMHLVIEQKNSRQSEPLQATDIISGAIFSKVEKNKISGTYLDISRNKDNHKK